MLKTFNRCKTALFKKGWRFCLQEVIKIVMPIGWIRNKSIIDLIYEHRSYRFLMRNYLPILKNYESGNSSTTTDHQHTIWVCWLQGEENAPEIVQRCIDSIRKNSNGMEITIVTSNNLSSLINIPEYITAKFRKKQMQYAQYSDYIRLGLLSKFGGIWIDATVYLTSPIPVYVSNSPLFCFQSSPTSISPSLLSSWFLSTGPDNPVINKVKYLMEEYWKRESNLCNYFLFHLLFSIVVKEDSECAKIWKEIPYMNNVDVHYLQFKLFEPFNSTQFEHICHLSFAHKLTYKFHNPESIKIPDTLYQYIIQNSCTNSFPELCNHDY